MDQPTPSIRTPPDRGQRELAEGAAGRRDAERHAALLRRHRAPHRAEHHREPGGADAEGNEHALAQVQPDRAACPGHPEQTCNVDHDPQQDDRYRAVTVGERAEDRLADSPDEALDRDGQREGLARDADVEAHRREEEAEAAADAVADGEHQRRAEDERENADSGPAHACGSAAAAAKG